MSTLATAVQARYSEDTLISLTRQKDSATSGINTTVLELACTDITAEFEVYVGKVFDSANAKHLTVACMGVLAKLKSWSRESPDASADEWDRWTKIARDLSKVTGRDRVSWTTTSQLTPSEEAPDGEEVRPAFDADAFDGYAPGRP